MKLCVSDWPLNPAGGWRLAELNHRSLLVNKSDAPAVLTCSPNLAGRHWINAGVYVPPEIENGGMWNGVNLKLSDENHFTWVSGGRAAGGFLELVWKEADLSGREINISGPIRFPGSGAGTPQPKTLLEYLRFEPLSQAEREHPARSPRPKELVIWLDPSSLALDAAGYYLNWATSSAKKANPRMDPAYWTTEKCEQVVAGYVARCAAAGADKIYWRVSSCGQSEYHTKIREIVHGSRYDWQTIDNVFNKNIDLLETAIRYGRRFGVKIYAYITLFDGSDDGGQMTGRFEQEHPEFQLLSRKAARMHLGRINYREEAVRKELLDDIACGVLCYAYPEVREFRLSEIRELVSYRPDGILLDIARSHNHYLPRTPDQFGYNRPIVEEYRKRWGVNILDEEFDREKWWRLQGEYLTLFLKEAAGEIRRHGQKVAVAFKPNPGNPYYEGNGRPILSKMHYDYPEWIAGGLIDEIALCNGHDRSGYTDWVTFNEPEFRKLLAGTGVKIYTYTAPERKPSKAALADEIRFVFRNETADGIGFFEGVFLDIYDYWSVLSAPELDPFRPAGNAAKIAAASQFFQGLKGN